MEVETGEDHAHFGVQKRAVDKALAVFGGYVPPEGWISAANKRNILAPQFVFNPCFADDEDLVLPRW